MDKHLAVLSSAFSSALASSSIVAAPITVLGVKAFNRRIDIILAHAELRWDETVDISVVTRMTGVHIISKLRTLKAALIGRMLPDLSVSCPPSCVAVHIENRTVAADTVVLGRDALIVFSVEMQLLNDEADAIVSTLELLVKTMQRT